MAIPEATPELESDGAKLFESPTSSAALRTLQSLGAAFLVVALFEASLFVPGVSGLLGVSVLEGAVIPVRAHRANGRFPP